MNNIHVYISSKYPLLIRHNHSNEQIIFYSLISKKSSIQNFSIKDCYQEKKLIKRNIRQQYRSGIFNLDLVSFCSFINDKKILVHEREKK